MGRSRPNKSGSARFGQSVRPSWYSSQDITGTRADVEPWLNLGMGIVERACIDIVYTNNLLVLHDAERFLLSDWFTDLCDMDQWALYHMLHQKRMERLEKEKQRKIDKSRKTIRVAQRDPNEL